MRTVWNPLTPSDLVQIVLIASDEDQDDSTLPVPVNSARLFV